MLYSTDTSPYAHVMTVPMITAVHQMHSTVIGAIQVTENPA